MAGNSFGRILRLTSYGESHGPGLGGVLDGCPAGLPLSEEDLQRELDLRKPGQGATATKRKESDTVRILSGVFQGLTTGTPIAFHIANEDQRSRDYGNLAQVFRPGHADWGFFKKFHGIRDYRGGGRSSEAGETVMFFCYKFNIPVSQTQAGHSALPDSFELSVGGVGVTGGLPAMNPLRMRLI